MISVNEHIQRRLTELPDRPGVYIMKNAQGKIIYIGKAKVLKNRVRSYFDGSEHNGHRAATLMLPFIRDIEWIITESEQEALILEANLIRKHTPKYNVLLKDDKHFPYLAFSVKEPFPRLTLSRSVGVMGDFRTYDYAIALRAVMTSDFMTAESAQIPWEVLHKVTNRIVNEVKGVNRVMYDCTSKPPATIEFE